MIETSVAFISLIDNDILRIEYKPDVFVGMPQFEENLHAYKTVMKTEKVFLLTIVNPGASMSLEVRNYFASKERSRFKLAEAFVITTLAHKIMADFVLRVQKPVHPISVFSNEEKAMDWLVKTKENYFREKNSSDQQS